MKQSVSAQNLQDMVQENLQNQPDTTFLDLQDQEIENLDVIMHMLMQFEFLEELNLSNNQLKELPVDLSQLKSVANLNLQNITFEDFETTVQSIATLPALRSLYVNLQTEDQVDLIMRFLPHIEFLNGLPVDRDALDQSQDDGGDNEQIAAYQKIDLGIGQDEMTEMPTEEDDS